MRLKHEIAVVTGAGGGFGEGIATLFAREGARVVVTDLNAAAAERVASAIGVTAIAVHGDVNKAPTCRRWWTPPWSNSAGSTLW